MTLRAAVQVKKNFSSIDVLIMVRKREQKPSSNLNFVYLTNNQGIKNKNQFQLVKTCRGASRHL